MNDLLSKLSSYHLFNYLLPGCLLAVIGEKMLHHPLTSQNVILGFFLYYFYGLIVSRLGSLIVEPILKKIGFLKYADYAQFVRACKADPKIDTLSETGNMYRTLCSLVVVLWLLKLYFFIEERHPGLKVHNLTFALVFLLAMFLFSYRKQSEYITKRIKVNNDIS